MGGYVDRLSDTSCESLSLDPQSHATETMPSSTDENQQQIRTSTASRCWLVVGDGDLSYSAFIAPDLARKNIHLIATVLEDEKVHQKVYERSKQNVAAILGVNIVPRESQPSPPDVPTFHRSHSVQFGIDATNLQESFSHQKFDCIQFNFPHWRGKTNAKRNRQLVHDFLQSASQFLKPRNSTISIALCQGQGGFPSQSLAEWRQSWLVPVYAAEHGLMLQSVEPFIPQYAQSSHRGIDRPWRKSGYNQRYTFAFPNHDDDNKKKNLHDPVDKSLQLSCRHELRIMLHPHKLSHAPVSRTDIVDGDAVMRLAQPLVPEGIDLEVAARDLLTPLTHQVHGKDDEDEREGYQHLHVPLALFLMNYSGSSRPITRQLADDIRSKLEVAVQEQWHLDVAKGGRLVSRPYPRHLLPTLIKEYNHRS